MAGEDILKTLYKPKSVRTDKKGTRGAPATRSEVKTIMVGTIAIMVALERESMDLI